MSRTVPKYRLHANGQAFVQHKSIPTSDNRMYLGTYGSEISKTRYQRFLVKLQASANAPAASLPPLDDELIETLILRYLEYAQKYYAVEGIPTKEYQGMKEALQPLLDLYGELPGNEFLPKDLGKLQDVMIGAKLARGVINNRISRIKRFFRWCCRQCLVRPGHYHELTCVDGLRKGRSGAKETEPIRPVAWHWVQLTLPFLSPTVRAMVQTQFYCGMRPDEVCRMRPMDLDMTGEIWLYRPPQHKNAWRDIVLVKAVPKMAQEILKPFLTRATDACLFTPAESRAWHNEQRKAHYRATRKCKVYPSDLRKREAEARQRAKTKRKAGTREAGTRFRTSAYDKSIASAIKHAAANGVEIPHWSPNQLRHGISTEIGKTPGLGEQAAQRWLGHARLETTSIYTEKTVEELIAIAKILDQKWAG